MTRRANGGGEQLHQWLTHLSGVLTAHGAEQFLTRMTAIAVADAPLSIAEREALVAMGAALAMSASHVGGVLQAVMADVED